LAITPKRIPHFNYDITLKEICARQDIARYLGFAAYKYLPYALDDAYDILYASLKMLPPFDEKSIMLYSSFRYNSPVITWTKDGSRIKANSFPSAGDVAAVKAMYPDVTGQTAANPP
jgi:hypothetical protein